MKIAVMIKQVPGTANVEVDSVTGVLKRDGIESKLNPYDLYAVEEALKIREDFGGEVTTVTMGPPQAKSAIQETICMGADNGLILSDRNFAGSDVLATSYTLSQGLKRLDSIDIYICGKQTTDGDTAQVGPEVAEFLGIPHITNVTKIINVTAESITVSFNADVVVQTVTVKFPVLITVEKDLNTPRLPSFKRKMEKFQNSENCDLIKFISLNDFDDKIPERYGLSGSPTQVERIFPPDKNENREIFEGNSNELSEKLKTILANKKFI